MQSQKFFPQRIAPQRGEIFQLHGDMVLQQIGGGHGDFKRRFPQLFPHPGPGILHYDALGAGVDGLIGESCGCLRQTRAEEHPGVIHGERFEIAFMQRFCGAVPVRAGPQPRGGFREAHGFEPVQRFRVRFPGKQAAQKMA